MCSCMRSEDASTFRASGNREDICYCPVRDEIVLNSASLRNSGENLAVLSDSASLIRGKISQRKILAIIENYGDISRMMHAHISLMCITFLDSCTVHELTLTATASKRTRVSLLRKRKALRSDPSNFQQTSSRDKEIHTPEQQQKNALCKNGIKPHT